MTRMNATHQGNHDLQNLFTYHPPTEDQINRYAAIRGAGRLFAEVLEEVVPPSPERTNALDRIREAVHWGNAGIACNEKDASQ